MKFLVNLVNQDDPACDQYYLSEEKETFPFAKVSENTLFEIAGEKEFERWCKRGDYINLSKNLIYEKAEKIF